MGLFQVIDNVLHGEGFEPDVEHKLVVSGTQSHEQPVTPAVDGSVVAGIDVPLNPGDSVRVDHPQQGTVAGPDLPLGIAAVPAEPAPVPEPEPGVPEPVVDEEPEAPVA